MRSAAMPYTTCPYCRSLLLRQGTDVRRTGEVAELPFDVSPVQLRMRGRADGVAFTVVGRVRWGWQDGSWNEWLLLLDDGRHRWLGEAMGMFMLTAEHAGLLDDPAVRRLADPGTIALGTTIEAGGSAFTAMDIKEAHCLGSEGDLPFSTLPDAVMTNVDFRAPDGSALSLQREAGGVTTAWLGRYVSLGQLEPTHLRQIEGWTVPEVLP